MKKYILTSPKFTGAVTFGYDFNNSLVFYHNECDNEAAINWLKTHLPPSPLELFELRKKIDGEIKEVPPDLSFETFWEAYDKKIHPKRCRPLWDKLSDAEKMQAIVNVKQYDAYLKRTGIGKAMPSNYLIREYYTVDWKREK